MEICPVPVTKAKWRQLKTIDAIFSFMLLNALTLIHFCFYFLFIIQSLNRRTTAIEYVFIQKIRQILCLSIDNLTGFE